MFNYLNFRIKNSELFCMDALLFPFSALADPLVLDESFRETFFSPTVEDIRPSRGLRVLLLYGNEMRRRYAGCVETRKSESSKYDVVKERRTIAARRTKRRER